MSNATAIYKSHYDAWSSFIREHLELLLNSRVFVFGAGASGCNLVKVLKIFKIPDVFFVDNDEEKLGKRIEGCLVLGFSEAKEFKGESVFLCGNQNSRGIFAQLSETGLEKHRDYFDLYYPLSDYLEVIDEIRRPIDGEEYSILFGSCTFSPWILSDHLDSSVGNYLQEELLGEECRIITLLGFSRIMDYHILGSMKLAERKPRYVMINMELSILSPHLHLLMTSVYYEQQRKFLEKLLEGDPPNREEIRDYLALIVQRLNRAAKLERKVTALKPVDFEEATKRVYELKYFYRVRETDESIVYTKKILRMLNDLDIPVILLFPPIDYMRGEAFVGADFREKFSATKDMVLSFFNGYAYSVIDASFTEDTTCFLPEEIKPDNNPYLNNLGKEKFIAFLREQSSLTQYLKPVG